MRRGNLPDGRHDKVIWKRSRDGSNSETWWRRTTATLLGVSFGSYRRCCRDVLKGCSGYVPMRRLGDVPLRFRWVLHLKLVWYVVETNWWEVVITSHETSSRHTNKSLWRLPLWRIGDVLGVSFGTYLQRRWDVQRDVVTTSPQRLVAGWVITYFERHISITLWSFSR